VYKEKMGKMDQLSKALLGFKERDTSVSQMMYNESAKVAGKTKDQEERNRMARSAFH
jgi:hypothetical protein